MLENDRVNVGPPDCKPWVRRGTRIYHQRNTHMPNDMVEAIQRYRIKNKLHSFSEAVRQLVEFGLEAIGDESD